MIYNNEISQENNPNATARLYIQENEILYKEYFIFNDLTKKNIDKELERDNYLKPEQAVEYGIIDSVVEVPKKNYKVKK